MYVNTTRHTESKCLNCGYIIDASSMFADGNKIVSPSEGDMAVCLMCRHLMIYNADLSLRNPTDEEVVEIAGDPDLVAAVTLLGAHQKDQEIEARRREGRSLPGDEEVSRQVHRQARRAALRFAKAVSIKATRPER
jgi:hypothetical protein